jgi:hypothetical protein
MSWDVAIYGDLVFPDAPAVARWLEADVDPAPEIDRGRDVWGRVGAVLRSVGDGRLDWIDVAVKEHEVAIRGQLTRDEWNERHPEVVAAVRAAADVGGRGELRMVGLGIELGFVLRLEDRSFTRVRETADDPRVSAIIAETARRVRLPVVQPLSVAPELLQLSRAKDPAHAIAIIESAPKGLVWKESTAFDEQLPELHRRFGRDVFPVLLAAFARHGGSVGMTLVKILQALETEEATEWIVERMSAPLMAGELATWLLEHPELALPVLRRVAAWPDDARGRCPVRVQMIAPMNELARRLIAELSNEPIAADPPMLRKGAKKPPAWFHPAVFARPRLVDGTRLSGDATKRLVALLKTVKDGDLSAFDGLLPLLDRRSLDVLLLELFHMWCDAGAKKPDRYFAEALRLLGDSFARERLTELSQKPTVAGRQARSLLG